VRRTRLVSDGMDRLTLAQLLDDARDRLERIDPEDLDAAVNAGAVVVDVRDSALRSLQGRLPDAYVIDLTVLEWRLAPSSDARIAEISPEAHVILVCSEGFSSSLAAARLKDLGVTNATDLVGGFKAWADLDSGDR
jgi:rhodanese-related sulfurtransferase